MSMPRAFGRKWLFVELFLEYRSKDFRTQPRGEGLIRLQFLSCICVYQAEVDSGTAMALPLEF